MFTNGACRGNPGPGGWAALLRMGNKEREVAGGEPLTTNNRMELVATIRGLESLKRPCRVELHTDSNYVRDGITRWVHKWQINGFSGESSLFQAPQADWKEHDYSIQPFTCHRGWHSCSACGDRSPLEHVATVARQLV